MSPAARPALRPQLVARELPLGLVSLVVAELFYKLGSFALELFAFGATWYALAFGAAWLRSAFQDTSSLQDGRR